jgi:hypothetical protein
MKTVQAVGRALSVSEARMMTLQDVANVFVQEMQRWHAEAQKNPDVPNMEMIRIACYNQAEHCAQMAMLLREKSMAILEEDQAKLGENLTELESAQGCTTSSILTSSPGPSSSD